MTSPPDDRSSVAVAYVWVSRLITVSLEMVLPGVFGLWVDGRLGITPVFTLLGFATGLTWGVWHLVRITEEKPAKPGESAGPTENHTGGTGSERRADDRTQERSGDK